MGRHKHVNQSKGTCYLDTLDEFGFRNQRFCFLSEEIKHTLYDEIIERHKEKKYFSSENIKNIIIQLVSALQHLEKNDIAFVNLHPENIFVNSNNQYKLGCFDQVYIINTKSLFF
jgi:serine/threonine protein kinase